MSRSLYISQVNQLIMQTKNPVVYRPTVQKGEHAVSNEEFMEYFELHFAPQLRDYTENPTKAVEKARHIACTSMKIKCCYFCRNISATAIRHVYPNRTENVQTCCKRSTLYCGHQKSRHQLHCRHVTPTVSFPCVFGKDCSQVPVTLMGCAGGGFALDTARTYLLAHPTHNVGTCALSGVVFPWFSTT